MQEVIMHPVDAIEIEPYHGDVLNLETEDQEYVVASVVVHNCPHKWITTPDKVAPTECPNLWMGAG